MIKILPQMYLIYDKHEIQAYLFSMAPSSSPKFIPKGLTLPPDCLHYPVNDLYLNDHSFTTKENKKCDNKSEFKYS